MPGLQQGTSSSQMPLKPPELAPQLFLEAKEITLVLDSGPLFLVTDINTPMSLKPQISGHPSPCYVCLLIQALQTFKERLSRLHSMVWMEESIVCLGSIVDDLFSRVLTLADPLCQSCSLLRKNKTALTTW